MGFCNLTDEQITAFVAEVKKLANYRVDGINLMDEGAEYGINGHPVCQCDLVSEAHQSTTGIFRQDQTDYSYHNG